MKTLADLQQFSYVGAQCAYAGYAINYFKEVAGYDHDTGAKLLAGAQGCFAVGRFIASGTLKFVKPRIVLLTFLTGVVVWACLAIGLKGNTGVASIFMVLFFESCVFPLIFSISMRGLGRHSKRGASFLVAAVSGGALYPPLLGLAGDNLGMQKAFFVPLIGFTIAWTFPIYLNLFKRKTLDGFLEKTPVAADIKDVESLDEKRGVSNVVEVEHKM